MASADPVYEIFWDATHLGDYPSDADLVKFPGWENVGGWQSTDRIEVPDKIFFEANLRMLNQIDYPFNDVAWPIMSRRMLDALLSAGPFPHRLAPVIMLDDTVPADRRLDDSGNPRPGVADEQFGAVQLLEHADLLDWEKSKYLPDERTPGEVRMITRVVLKESAEPPPLFRLSAKPRVLFVSAAAREALEAAHIHGVIYRSLEKVRV
jgi:hypothetical protein